MSADNTNKKPFLFVLTSHDSLGNSHDKTGFHFSEMAEPYLILTEAGIEVELASVKGGEPPVDPGSIEDADEREQAIITQFKNDERAVNKLVRTKTLEDVNMDDYSGVFFPGGHGTMWDFVDNPALTALVEKAWADNKILAAVCHGPAAFIDAKNGDDKPLVSGKEINSFTDEEEKKIGKDKIVPFLLETRLRARGALFQGTDCFKPCLIVDGNFITGQNPVSARGVAQAILEKLGHHNKAIAAE